MPARESLWVTVTEQQQHYFVQVKHYYFLLLLPILISHTPLLFLSGQAEHKSFRETRKTAVFHHSAKHLCNCHWKRKRREQDTKTLKLKREVKESKVECCCCCCCCILRWESNSGMPSVCLPSDSNRNWAQSWRQCWNVLYSLVLLVAVVMVVVTAQLLLVISYCWY